MNAEYNFAAGVDRLIHEPNRMMIMAVLYAAGQADFLYLLGATGLTKGNLSTHLARLEQGGYVHIEKVFRGKVPHTLLTLTPQGKTAFATYREQLKKLADALPSNEPDKTEITEK